MNRNVDEQSRVLKRYNAYSSRKKTETNPNKHIYSINRRGKITCLGLTLAWMKNQAKLLIWFLV